MNGKLSSLHAVQRIKQLYTFIVSGGLFLIGFFQFNSSATVFSEYVNLSQMNTFFFIVWLFWKDFLSFQHAIYLIFFLLFFPLVYYKMLSSLY